jgi:hypothetical protein
MILFDLRVRQGTVPYIIGNFFPQFDGSFNHVLGDVHAYNISRGLLTEPTGVETITTCKVKNIFRSQLIPHESFESGNLKMFGPLVVFVVEVIVRNVTVLINSSRGSFEQGGVGELEGIL